MKAILLFLILIISMPFSYSQNMVALATGNAAGRNKPVSSGVEQNEADSVALPEMILIQGGTFEMGSTEGLSDEKPVHQVTLNNYYLGKYEVTVAQFGQFISETGYKTDADKDGGSFVSIGNVWDKKAGMNWKCDTEGNERPVSEFNYPVINVSWRDANEYCKWLSRKTGNHYHLPTEAEWEYAAGNGTKHTRYSWGNDDPLGNNGGNIADESAREVLVMSLIWYGYNDGFIYLAPVGSFNPNEFGLYDMTGNVGEWCGDLYGSKYYKSSPRDDPRGPSEGSYRVIRGGTWWSQPDLLQVFYRDRGQPSYRYFGTGFRIAMSE